MEKCHVIRSSEKGKLVNSEFRITHNNKKVEILIKYFKLKLHAASTISKKYVVVNYIL